MKRFILALILVLGLVGCGESSGDSTSDVRGDTSTTVIETEGDVTVKEVTVTDEGVYIDCGVGGCGDVIVGNEGDVTVGDRVSPSEEFDLDGDGEDDDGTCPEGYFYCSIEGKCVPGESDTPCGG